MKVLENNLELECENEYVEKLYVIIFIFFDFCLLFVDVGMIRDYIREF